MQTSTRKHSINKRKTYNKKHTMINLSKKRKQQDETNATSKKLKADSEIPPLKFKGETFFF